MITSEMNIQSAAACPVIPSKENELKNICRRRLLYAFVHTIAMQYFLLTIFLLFINFNILHPLVWIKESISLLFSFYTWLWITPLICIIIMNGVVIGRQFLVVSKYYHSRMNYIVMNCMKQSTSTAVNALIGLLTAWLYIHFLGGSYSVKSFNNDKRHYLNEKYIFLLMNGVFMGFYYSLNNKLTDYRVVFPVILQSKYLLVRANLYKTIISSLFESFFPLLIYVTMYLITGSFLIQKSSVFIGCDYNVLSLIDRTYFIVTDFRLLFYMWLLGSQILSNMNLMVELFNIFLTEYYQFSIDKMDEKLLNDTNELITLVDALSFKDLEITRQLAALDLYMLSESIQNARRRAYYKLSLPGGHPHNWKSLSNVCLNIIQTYSKELKEAIDKINAQPQKQCQTNNNLYKPNATIMAEKIVFRQYNEASGIRNITSYTNTVPSSSNTGSLNKNPAAVNVTMLSYITKIKNDITNKIPGVHYLFGEEPEAKTFYLLTSQSQTVVWLAQGLASLCKHSITEDSYGVVQDDLAAIIKTLIQLKLILDKVGTLNFAGKKKINYNYIRLRNAVKRSIYHIVTAFSSYITDIPIDSNDLNIVHSFIKYKEI